MTTTRAAAQKSKGIKGICLDNRFLWTVTDFERAVDLGAFGTDERLELIEGEIIRKMTQKEPHTMSLHLTQRALEAVFGPDHYVRVQSPLVFPPRSRPEPDIAVVRGSIRDYVSHPTTALLVVEISDTTLLTDQTTKAALYARAGIPEYWIVNLPERLIEVYRQPGPMPTQPLGHGYRSLTRHPEGTDIAPRDFPGVVLPVSGLLP